MRFASRVVSNRQTKLRHKDDGKGNEERREGEKGNDVQSCERLHFRSQTADLKTKSRASYDSKRLVALTSTANIDVSLETQIYPKLYT